MTQLPPGKLDDMWQSGYCDETVRHAQQSKDREDRIAWMTQHVGHCDDCHFANCVKALEAAVSLAMGCFELFDAGGDVTGLPGFYEAQAQEISKGVGNGTVTYPMLVWMSAIASRRGHKPWPGNLERY